MSDSDNFSRRISLRTKELLSSNTGFSALLIFLTLLLLGFVFGMRFQPQPFIIQDASSLDPDLISTIDQSASSQQNMNERIVTDSEFTSSPNQRSEPVYVQKEKFEDYLSLNEEGRKIERQHANELSDLVV